jgi:hyaluronoglucosaminidase
MGLGMGMGMGGDSMATPVGIIEGYYGRPWSWPERTASMQVLARHGYSFFLYAPKADAHLRKRWREPYPAEQRAELTRFAEACRDEGVTFGVGLSPYELYLGFDAAAREDLDRRLSMLAETGVRWLAILFDDMRGDVPGLAASQADILHWIADRGTFERLILCPTYYTDDPVLDRVFGHRPADYLETLGRTLDPAIDLFWTGEEVCARDIGVGHLKHVAGVLGRKPMLWDNYPVNDGPHMSSHLHLRGFTGRPAAIGAHLSAHAVNPALQPTLSLIPALTLVESYRLGDDYAYGDAFRRAAIAIAGEELGVRLWRDLHMLQDMGLEAAGTFADRLRQRYGRYDHPAAREVLAWLDGAYRFTTLED